MGSHDPRRRYYALTVLRDAGEESADTDRRVMELLGVSATSASVTLSAYDPVADEWTKIQPPRPKRWPVEIADPEGAIVG